MPRNGAEVYSKPANTTAVSGQTIESAKYNQTIDDIVDDLNLDRPVEAGGTGASNATDARSNLLAATKRTRSAKAANYTAQAADDGAWFEATAAITLSFAAAATLGNRWECLVFANGGDVTLNPNGVETINGAATLTIEDGGAALVHCTGTTLHAVTMQAPIEFADVTGALGYTPVPAARTVSGAGLATGGGDLTANRTITVTAASQAEAEAGTDNTKAMTPLRTQQAMDANVYTGNDVNNTDFPIGQILVIEASTGVDRNATIDVRLNGSTGYIASGAGTLLPGTWKKLCNASGATSLVVRVS